MEDQGEKRGSKRIHRLPEWLKRPLPAGAGFSYTDGILKSLGLTTVCREANCPNIGECWARRTATFMILGDVCTRNCRFCAVRKGLPSLPDKDEPKRVAEAAKRLGLRHVVITSVSRDDLEDEGAGHFAEVIRQVKSVAGKVTIEVLVPDFHARSDCLDAVIDAGPDIFNHNLETVEDLSLYIRPQANYGRSLEVLSYVKKRACGSIITKSGIMVGLGENDNQIRGAIEDLAAAGVDIITVGQYLAPTRSHYPTQRFYPPEWFNELKEWAEKEFNFLGVFAGPFVRSSYLADIAFRLAEKREPC